MIKLTGVIAIVMSMGALLWCLSLESSRQKVAFLEMDNVFNAFDMKIELEKDFQKRLNASEIQIEHWTMRKAELTDAGKSDSVAILGDWIRREQETIGEYMKQLKPDYDNQIQNRLSVYIMEYIHSGEYDLFFTTLNGSTILHGSPDLNHTEKVIDFVNRKYAGN